MTRAAVFLLGMACGILVTVLWVVYKSTGGLL